VRTGQQRRGRAYPGLAHDRRIYLVGVRETHRDGCERFVQGVEKADDGAGRSRSRSGARGRMGEGILT
jgi:hypothetical protein